MKNLLKYVKLSIILSSILLSASLPASPSALKTLYALKPTQKTVLKLGTTVVVAYVAKKAYKNYAQKKSLREMELKDYMAQKLREIAWALKKQYQVPLAIQAAEAKAAQERQKIEAERQRSEAKRRADLKRTQQEHKISAAAASDDTQAKKLEDARRVAEQIKVDQKKAAERKAAEAELAPYTAYTAASPTIMPAAPTVTLEQQAMRHVTPTVDAQTTPAQETKQTVEQKIEAEHMLIPLEPAQKTIVDLYNLGREYVARIYKDEAATIPQATLQQFQESLRAIMWFLYIVSEEKSQCAFEEGTICIHDAQNRLYQFLLTHNFATQRISTHFAEFEAPADSPRRASAEERKQDYGIDVSGLPTGKQHILFGKLKEEFCYIKLENYGLGITGIIPHGYEAFIAYIRKIKTVRSYTGMVSDDHETFRKERIPEDVSAKALEFLITLNLEHQEFKRVSQQFKKFGIQVIVPFFEFYVDRHQEIADWIDMVKKQYPDYKYRKGREVILSQQEILNAPTKDSSKSVVVLDE